MRATHSRFITPLSDRLAKRPVVIPSGDVGAMASRLTRGHDRETVLFVGDGRNVPQLVQELSGIEVGPVTEKEHDTLYVVSIPTFGRASVLRLIN